MIFFKEKMIMNIHSKFQIKDRINYIKELNKLGNEIKTKLQTKS